MFSRVERIPITIQEHWPFLLAGDGHPEPTASGSGKRAIAVGGEPETSATAPLLKQQFSALLCGTEVYARRQPALETEMPSLVDSSGQRPFSK
jgi:hypothetical protein